MNAKTVILTLVGLFLLAVVAVGGLGYWYLFGPNSEDAAQYLPSNTLFFSGIDNGTSLIAEAQGSRVADLIRGNAKARQQIADGWTKVPAETQTAILNGVQSLSGQSFAAFTSYNILSPSNSSAIIGCKPKPGFDTFKAFSDAIIKQVPDLDPTKDIHTDAFNGVSYRYIQKSGMPVKICLAQTGYWEVVTFGEPALEDWVNRYQHKVTTPSLADNTDFKQAMKRLGSKSEVKSYFNIPEAINQTKLFIPANISPIPLDKIGGVAIGTSIDGTGYITDRIAWNLPESARASMGNSTKPCPYDTEKFTNADTQLYAAGTVDLETFWTNLKTQMAKYPEQQAAMQNYVQSAQQMGIDIDKNVALALGDEGSIQMDWTSGQDFPQGCAFIKVKDAAAFKPVLSAIETASMVAPGVSVTSIGDQHLKTMPIPMMPAFSPGYTTDGPYFAIFSSKEEAQRCFTTGNPTLATRPEVGGPGGVLLGHSTNVAFIDLPRITDNVAKSQTIMSMMTNAGGNKDFVDALADPDQRETIKKLGVFSMSTTWDDDGMTMDLNSGVGGINLAILSGIFGYLDFNVLGINPQPPTDTPPVSPVPSPAPNDTTAPSPAPGTDPTH